ncbi:hypothetical protein DAEQUDRAFT_201283 [Daedalea quercina L-15889]|uniref:Uncharacterized protein n=1 Tax=Daedalea quercina L-15889 TaxID=1314783 RepID=A0A165U9U8_9APHY|nr:hypothetical protein DAEQUDRAFT_201283 [Daedalea quercina L-15889]
MLPLYRIRHARPPPHAQCYFLPTWERRGLPSHSKPAAFPTLSLFAFSGILVKGHSDRFVALTYARGCIARSEGPAAVCRP